jgi:hypothetical protein
MRTLVCWIPAIFAFYLLYVRSLGKIFINLYLPVLLLLPQHFYALTSGFPKLNFSQTTIIPIFLFFLKTHVHHWKLSLMDILVLGFIFWKFVAEFENADLHYAINKLAPMLCSILAPYVLAKGLISNKTQHEAVVKKIVILMVINLVLSLSEIIFSYDLQTNVISKLFFPGNFNIPLKRFGFTRIVGPFSESILYGIGISTAILLNYWICKNKLWKSNLLYIPKKFISKGTGITLLLIAGLIANLSRGPIIGCFLGFLVIGASLSKRPIVSLAVRMVGVFILLTGLYHVYSTYSSPSETGEYNESLETENNAVYRWELIKVYSRITWESPWVGWGTLNPPLQKEYNSIDNEYLLVLLNYGVIALGVLLTIFIVIELRLLIKTLFIKKSQRWDISYNICLMSVIGMMAFCFLTVFMGSQTEPLLFLILGLAENRLRTKSQVEEIDVLS